MSTVAFIALFAFAVPAVALCFVCWWENRTWDLRDELDRLRLENRRLRVMLAHPAGGVQRLASVVPFQPRRKDGAAS